MPIPAVLHNLFDVYVLKSTFRVVLVYAEITGIGSVVMKQARDH